ncbi:hypothetical protein L2E82_45064 [Cichorium intybus]|uniref:Uncharacterized protein n=1 Tax=Cichorium intybus TaxID=13427 RepID=A0ACB8ZSX6_CICIN|nr:hypothetical protein L2E82_45064 [Cichorium intybus]
MACKQDRMQHQWSTQCCNSEAIKVTKQVKTQLQLYLASADLAVPQKRSTPTVGGAEIMEVITSPGAL